MTALMVAVIATLITALIQGLVFRKRERMLRAKEQCFRFHELRDKLQLLQLEHAIEADSLVFGFLCAVINFAIHNAGVAKLSDALLVSKKFKQKVESDSFQQVREELRSCPPEVQALSSDVFDAFAQMLVANDDVTYGIYLFLDKATRVARIATTTVLALKPAAKFLSPKRVEVFREARQYRRIGRRLAPSH